MPFAYYENLSRRDQRTYRSSDKIGRIELPEPERFGPLVDRVRATLAEGKTRPVQQACARLCRALTDAYDADPVRVKIFAKRPYERDGGELHGQYHREDGKRSIIEVWMRTAAHKRVVAFKTFLRTLIHEILHHFDYEIYALEESFHTEGFFKRESSLTKQLLAVAAKPEPVATPKPIGSRRREPTAKPTQIELPW